MKRKNMKRFLAAALALVMILSCAVLMASAESSNVNVSVDGASVDFNSDLGTPFIDNQSRTMVPFRAVANFMDNVEVSWNNDAREAIFIRSNVPVIVEDTDMYADVTVRFPIGTNQAWQNIDLHNGDGRWYFSYHRFLQMDTQSLLKGGRTYAPIRFLAEDLGYEVGWDGATRTVLIDSPAADWGESFIGKYGPEDQIVTSESIARCYASEFRRLTEGNTGSTDVNLVGECTGFLGRESDDVTGWVYDYKLDGKEMVVYVNDKGQTWYHDSTMDKDVYTIWR